MLEWGTHQVTTVNADNLLQAGQVERVKKGALIFREGDASEGVFLVVEGEVEGFTIVRGRAAAAGEDQRGAGVRRGRGARAQAA